MSHDKILLLRLISQPLNAPWFGIAEMVTNILVTQKAYNSLKPRKAKSERVAKKLNSTFMNQLSKFKSFELSNASKNSITGGDTLSDCIFSANAACGTSCNSNPNPNECFNACTISQQAQCDRLFGGG